VSVWHGTKDLTVAAVNATEIVRQWTDVHGLSASPTRQEGVDAHPRRVWENAAGEVVIEDYLIAGMDHGTPIAISTGEQRHGVAGPFLLDVGIASRYHIARFWGVTDKEPAPALQVSVVQTAAPTPEPVPATWIQRLRTGLRRVLRQAGLVE